MIIIRIMTITNFVMIMITIIITVVAMKTIGWYVRGNQESYWTDRHQDCLPEDQVRTLLTRRGLYKTQHRKPSDSCPPWKSWTRSPQWKS